MNENPQSRPPMQPPPFKSDPEDRSRPGPITFLILIGLAGLYVFYSYHDSVLAFLGML